MTTHENDSLAERFQEHRLHLRAVAYRMLGSARDAEDALQECWLRASEARLDDAEDLGSWLTRVVARVSLDVLRSREAALDQAREVDGSEPDDDSEDPAQDGQHSLPIDAAGPALMAALETLAPGERVAFVLHDLFKLPFEEVAPVLDLTPAASRQLASRARRRVRGAAASGAPQDAAREADRAEQRRVVDAFLTASRAGDFGALLALLDPGVVLRADDATVRLGTAKETRGAGAIAGTFRGRARFARLALVDGALGAISAPGGTPRVAYTFTVVNGRIAAIDLTADPEQLRRLDVFLLLDRP